MKIEIISCLKDNYSYLIFEKKTNTVSIIDPSDFNSCDKIIKKYKKLDYILNTHHHADHVDGNIKLKEKYNSKIIGFKEDSHRIPGIDTLLKDSQVHKIECCVITSARMNLILCDPIVLMSTSKL